MMANENLFFQSSRKVYICSAKVIGRRIMHKSYMCIDGYKPATVSMSNNEKLPLQAKTSCEKKQFCAPEQICMQRGKLGYCCDKGHPSKLLIRFC